MSFLLGTCSWFCFLIMQCGMMSYMNSKRMSFGSVSRRCGTYPYRPPPTCSTRAREPTRGAHCLCVLCRHAALASRVACIAPP
jgi:hypothetical protein